MSLPAWVPPDELKPAPEPLLLVQAFVNTRDLRARRSGPRQPAD